MSADIISVIVPVYKVEKFLVRCVESILAQTYKNLEIILVDDGSPDGSPELCDELSRKYANIQVIHKENGGLSSARNVGIENSHGKYISFIDSDDYIDSNMLMRLYQLIFAHGADVAMCQYLEVNDNTVLPQIKETEERVYVGKEVEEAFLALKVDGACVCLYSREAIGDIRFPLGKTSEDIPFNFRVFRRINRFVFVPERRYYYYYNINSISNGCLNKNMFNYLFFREEIYSFYKDKGDDRLLEMSEVLYARAAMGLITRMAVFGISKELNEAEEYKHLRNVLMTHRKCFFSSSMIPLSRKLMGFCGLYAYNVLKIIGRIRR